MRNISFCLVFQIVQRNIMSYVNSLSKVLYRSSTEMNRLAEEVLNCFREFAENNQKFVELNEMDEEFVT